MTLEQDNELEPMYLGIPHFGQLSTFKLLEDPDKVLPVYTKIPTSKEPKIDFFLSIVREEGKRFLQAEGFTSDELEKDFVVRVSDRWSLLQPGIWRLDITEMVKGVL
jgi:hypothetical protein